MRLKTFTPLFFLTLLILAAPLMVSAYDNSQAYVVASDLNGNTNYMESYGDGTFSPLVFMGRLGKYCYGNGIGDFDNDGDYDFIVATGSTRGYVYLYEKLGSGNNFASPVILGSWNEGRYVMDIPIADFNEDGNLDFILTNYETRKCELFTGDGSLGFTSSVLSDTAPDRSIGADAADFNNDGHADFVAMPWSYPTEFYVNLGNGDGTFATIRFPTHSNTRYWGVAAADFDSDGNVDLVATYRYFMDFYKGEGDGTFVWSHRINDNNIYYSPVDNYDFDGDGNQDIVAGRCNAYYRKSVGVFLGNGDGTFAFSAAYGGGSGQDPTSISAPPSERNLKPFAIVEPAYQEITAGQAALFDASGSYDDDGQILGYEWDYGDGSVGTGTSTPHLYYDAGLYTVTLTVADDKGATNSVQAQVYVVAVLAEIQFTPRTLNLKSKGNWVNVAIALPAEYDVSQVDLRSVCITAGDSLLVFALNDPKYGFVAKAESGNVLKVKFNRQAVEDAILEPSYETVLRIRGKIYYNGGLTDFSGSTIVRTMMPGKRR